MKFTKIFRLLVFFCGLFIIIVTVHHRSARVPGASGACLAPTEAKRRPRRPCQNRSWIMPRVYTPFRSALNARHWRAAPHREAILHGPGRVSVQPAEQILIILSAQRAMSFLCYGNCSAGSMPMGYRHGAVPIALFSCQKEGWAGRIADLLFCRMGDGAGSGMGHPQFMQCILRRV